MEVTFVKFLAIARDVVFARKTMSWVSSVFGRNVSFALRAASLDLQTTKGELWDVYKKYVSEKWV